MCCVRRDASSIPLLPRPRSIRPLGGSVMLDLPLRAPVDPEGDSLAAGLPTSLISANGRGVIQTCGTGGSPASGSTGRSPEAYTLRIDPHGVSIDAPTDAGVRNALRTLAQLIRAAGPEVPCVEIEDAPAFAVRGVMLDVSRCRVPTIRELFDTVDLLASLKINHLQLYTEHAFAYSWAPEVWAGVSPMTPEEVRRLDAHCKSRGVELVANQNCFGHLKPWLVHERFAPLAETHGDWSFAGVPRSGPFSLCPIDPGSIRFVEKMLDDLLPCFSSSLVNIGCDETYDIGQGRSREAVDRGGKAEVYARFVAQVCKLATDRGRRPAFWADIAAEHPRVLDLLPKEAIALVWNYEPDADFAGPLREARARGMEGWVCPGTSSWRSITGRASERRANLHAAAAQGLDAGASGCLITDWGDTGHHQVWPVALRAIAQGAQAAWRGGLDDDPLEPEATSMHALGAPGAAEWLDAFGDADLDLRQISGVPCEAGPTRLHNASALFSVMFPAGEGLKLDHGVAWGLVRERIEALRESIPGEAGSLLHDELSHACDVGSFAASLAIAREDRNTGGQAASATARLLRHIMHDHARLWRIRSREGGLAESLGFYERLLGEVSA
ncbi:MAG: glycoside hydrolase [Phycisphaerales bacterium]|nr:MAG: glycoside hydrolase [Phycisphaerales bacterium]